MCIWAHGCCPATEAIANQKADDVLGKVQGRLLRFKPQLPSSIVSKEIHLMKNTMKCVGFEKHHKMRIRETRHLIIGSENRGRIPEIHARLFILLKQDNTISKRLGVFVWRDYSSQCVCVCQFAMLCFHWAIQ